MRFGLLEPAPFLLKAGAVVRGERLNRSLAAVCSDKCVFFALLTINNEDDVILVWFVLVFFRPPFFLVGRGDV